MKHIIKAYVMLNHLHLYHNTPVPHLLQAPNAMEGGHFFLSTTRKFIQESTFV